MNMAQRIELKLDSIRGAAGGAGAASAATGCEVESVAKLPLWHSQTVHLSASTPLFPLARFPYLPCCPTIQSSFHF